MLKLIIYLRTYVNESGVINSTLVDNCMIKSMAKLNIKYKPIISIQHTNRLNDTELTNFLNYCTATLGTNDIDWLYVNNMNFSLIVREVEKYVIDKYPDHYLIVADDDDEFIPEAMDTLSQILTKYTEFDILVYGLKMNFIKKSKITEIEKLESDLESHMSTLGESIGVCDFTGMASYQLCFITKPSRLHQFKLSHADEIVAFDDVTTTSKLQYANNITNLLMAHLSTNLMLVNRRPGSTQTKPEVFIEKNSQAFVFVDEIQTHYFGLKTPIRFTKTGKLKYLIPFELEFESLSDIMYEDLKTFEANVLIKSKTPNPWLRNPYPYDNYNKNEFFKPKFKLIYLQRSSTNILLELEEVLLFLSKAYNFNYQNIINLTFKNFKICTNI